MTLTIKKKIIKYNKKIFKLESKFNLEYTYKLKYNYDQITIFYQKFIKYKLLSTILFDDPCFYLLIKFIDLDKSTEINEYVYNEIIWIHEHYCYIEKIRLIESELNLLLKYSLKNNWLTRIQYKLIKMITPKIIKIFESDKIFSNLYEYNNNSNKINYYELNFYFTIIEIIFCKLFLIIKKFDNFFIKEKNIINLIYDKKYLNLICKLKNNLKIKSNIL